MKIQIQLAITTLLICCTAAAFAAPAKRLPEGMWGGPQLRLEATESGATLEFGCGSATIAGPITLDQNGHFQASGTYKQGDFGPTREDGPSAREASFTGSLEGDTLKLEMVLSGEDRVQKFTVTRGRESRLVKCK